MIFKVSGNFSYYLIFFMCGDRVVESIKKKMKTGSKHTKIYFWNKNVQDFSWKKTRHKLVILELYE